MMKQKNIAKMFDFTSNIIMLTAFVTLILAFIDVHKDIGLGFSDEDLPAIVTVGVSAVLIRVVGVVFFKLISRFEKNDHRR